MSAPQPNPRRPAFTLVELLVVIGIIALLISMLLPALSKTRKQANSIVCRAHLHDIGLQLLAYSNQNRGWLFPEGEGADKLPQNRWPVIALEPSKWDSKLLLCPADEDPQDLHSYVLNAHLSQKKIKYGRTHFHGRTVSDVVVLGEKNSKEQDYYMDPPGDFPRVVALRFHGPALKSNYLHLDMSVSNDDPTLVPGAADPWDPVP